MKKTILNFAAIITIISISFIACFDKKQSTNALDRTDSTKQNAVENLEAAKPIETTEGEVKIKEEAVKPEANQVKVK